MFLKYIFSRRTYFAAAALFILSGCRNIDTYRQERIEKADRHFLEIKAKDFPEDTVFTLPFCIETALKNNLDLKVQDLKEAVSSEKKTAEMLGMLPDLEITNDLSKRDNEPGATSMNIKTGEQSLTASKSSEKGENKVKAELLFSVIDFGLAYFKSVQQEDQKILVSEQKRRMTQNLAMDVTTAYFRIAATQYAMESTEDLIKICKDTEAILTELTENRNISPLRAMDEQKRFLQLQKRLMEYRRSYENSCFELRGLMGYAPLKEIKVDTSVLRKISEIFVPDIEILEQISLRERPELYQNDIQRHITVIEARKNLLMMFPNVRAFVDFTGSSNKYLYERTWWEVGVRAAYHLLKIPQQIEEYSAINLEVSQMDMQIMALSIGIMTQVRIAHANFYEVRERFLIADKIYEAYKSHLEAAEKSAVIAGILAPIELRRLKMATAEASIERTQELGNYYLAYYRLLNAVGVQSLEPEKISEFVESEKKAGESGSINDGK